jgi:hypothetical protein
VQVFTPWNLNYEANLFFHPRKENNLAKGKERYFVGGHPGRLTEYEINY